MAFAVLFSTCSFTVESHYCGNRLVDTAIFTKVKSCGMWTSANIPVKKGCCKDKVELIKGQDELKLNSSETLDFDQQFGLATLMYSYGSRFKGFYKLVIPHKNYSPPHVICDIIILGETFLI